MGTTYQQTILSNLAAAQRLLQQLCDSSNADLALTASREIWATANTLYRLRQEPSGACPADAVITPLEVLPGPPRRSPRSSRPKRRQRR